jgi:3-oxoacyl-[acyl-carrier protein] reductase
VRSAIVTGASGTVGGAIASAFCREGLRVGAGFLANGDAVAALEQAHPGRVERLRVDLRDRAAVRDTFSSFVESTDGLDALVCCAGIFRPSLLARSDEASIREQCDVNLLGTIFSVQAALPAMLRRRAGCIVTVSSVAAARPSAGQAVYSATKSAVEAFTRGIAVEYASRGIRAYCVRLGPVQGPMLEQLPDAARETATRRTFGGKAAQASSVASLVAFLAGQECGSSSGAILDLDGGFLLS